MRHRAAVTIAVLVVATAAITACAEAVNPVHRRVAEAVEVMDRSGLFAVGDEWARARQEALGAVITDDEASGVIRDALIVAGGEHSTLLLPGSLGDAGARESPTVTDLGDVVVLTLPAIASVEGEAVTDYAAAGLTAVGDHEPRCGWILDLRENYGGNMYPMLAAIAPFIDVAEPLMFVDRDGRSTPVTIDQYGVRSEDETLRMPLNSVGDLAHGPLAVLIGPKTASSGEAVTIALRGRPKVKTFGQSTYGFATANEVHQLADGHTLLLTQAWTGSRDGTTFPSGVAPDIATDLPLEAGIEWLEASCES